MDVFLSFQTVTDIPLYNCSAFTNDELMSRNSVRRPYRGVATFIIGAVMVLIYIACLRAMIKLELVRKACYKIMFVIGIYDIVTVSINDMFFAYLLASGTAFCDAPNVFYTIGCIYLACWAGASYFCLYLAFNRILEILKLSRKAIDFFFSSVRTTLGILVGVFYSLMFVLFCTPPVYSNDAVTALPNPLGFDDLSAFEMRHGLLIANSLGVVTVTVILYGIFFVLFRKNIERLGFLDRHNRLQHQVFIQSTLMCAFNFGLTLAYVFFLFLIHHIIVPQICLIVYQLTSGFQALIYLFCNQTILNGVKDDLFCLLRVKREVTTDMRTNKSSNSEQSQPEGSAIYVAENKFAAI